MKPIDGALHPPVPYKHPEDLLPKFGNMEKSSVPQPGSPAHRNYQQPQYDSVILSIF